MESSPRSLRFAAPASGAWLWLAVACSSPSSNQSRTTGSSGNGLDPTPSGAAAGSTGTVVGNGTSGTVGAAGTPQTTGGAGGAVPLAGSGGAAGDAGLKGTGGAGGITSAGGAGGGPAGGAGAAASGGSAGSAGTGGSGGSGGSGGAENGPCDLYAMAKTPCVAAHSTVRALYAAYSGNLYQVRRASDKTTKDIAALGPGGFADSAAQDAFCAGTTCTISILYDQSEKANHLKSAPAGGYVKTPDAEANATALKLMVGGHAVYAIYVNPGTGYRNDKTAGIATGDQPEGEYMVTSGKHYNGGCCFDYGNAETSNNDTGNGHMEAIYFGNNTGWGRGAGNGPWVMADLENGLFAGGNAGLYASNTSITSEYVTAIIKGEPGHWAIKAGDAQKGKLTTMWDGQRPSGGYDPMHKEGAIILGIGGDNSNGAAGTFFEGCMTSGYPSDATEDAVQANIVAAGYGR